MRLHTIETLPKGNRTRTVPYPIGLRRDCSPCAREETRTPTCSALPRGGYWQANNWRSRIWRPLLRDVGMDDIEGLSIHSLRHSYASIAIKNGCDVKTPQTILGHASATETLDTYADLWPDRLSEVADAMNMDLTGA
ncbi:MAG: tyrosine-type recombinase/integrase [Bifidobacterium bifidum]